MVLIQKIHMNFIKEKLIINKNYTNKILFTEFIIKIRKMLINNFF